MASVDGARSVKKSSEEGFQFECGPCENDGVTVEATYFCPECKDYLCESCETSHKRFRSTRSHKVFAVSTMPASLDDVQIAESCRLFCLCHRNEVELYCEFHDEVFCSDCKIIRHRLCQTVLIDEMVNELDQNFGSTTLKDANDTKDTYMKLQIIRKQDRETLFAETERCKADIKSFKRELNQHLDKIEASALKDLYISSDLHNKVIDQHLDACDTALSTLSLDYDNQVASKHGRQKFLANVKLRRTLTDLNAAFRELHEEISEPHIFFDRNKTLSAVLSTCNFGGLRHNLSWHPKIFNANMKVRRSRTLNINLPSDQMIPWISGSVFLPGGDLVLCDRNNKCLKIFDRDFSSKETFILTGSPRDCCYLIFKNKLLVTVPEKKKIQYFQTVPTLQLDTEIDLDMECDGITSLGQNIYVTCYSSSNKEIRILDQDGHLTKTISLNEGNKDTSHRPCYIATHKKGDVFVSETSLTEFQSQIRTFSKEGLCKNTYSDSQLKGALGMLVDGEGRLLVCVWKLNMVVVLSKDGVTTKDFFDANVEVTAPYSISYRESDATLIVTSRDKKEILICEMT